MGDHEPSGSARIGAAAGPSVPSAGHASAAPEPARVPPDHDRGRGAAGDHHRHRWRGAPQRLGPRVPVVAQLLERSAHRARAVRLAPVDRVAQPHVHRPRVGRGHRGGAREPRAHPEAHGSRVAVTRPRRRRVRAGGARRAHRAVRSEARLRDGALPAVDRPAHERTGAGAPRRSARRARAGRRERTHDHSREGAARPGQPGADHRHGGDRRGTAQRGREEGRRLAPRPAHSRGRRACTARW